MNLPKDNKELDQIFTNGSEPTTEEFVEEYWVNMLTGMIPNFRWVGHRKRFFKENGSRIGNNIILFNSRFGHFTVEQGQCDDLNDLKVIILNYGEKRNLLTRSVRDKIRKIEDGLYLGRYYNVLDGTFHFKGYFSLVKR
jgi:hypothetical protein